MNKNQMTPQREGKIIAAILAVGMLVPGLASTFVPGPAPTQDIDMFDIDISSSPQSVEDIFVIFGPVLWLLLFCCALWFERKRYYGRKT